MKKLLVTFCLIISHIHSEISDEKKIENLHLYCQRRIWEVKMGMQIIFYSTEENSNYEKDLKISYINGRIDSLREMLSYVENMN